MVRLIIVWNCSVSPRLNKEGAGVLVSKMKKKTCYLYYSDFKQTYKRLHPPGFFWADSVVIVSLHAEGPRLKVHF